MATLDGQIKCVTVGQNTQIYAFGNRLGSDGRSFEKESVSVDANVNPLRKLYLVLTYSGAQKTSTRSCYGGTNDFHLHPPISVR